MNGEFWKSVHDYEGLYEISNLGNIRSLTHLVRGRYGNMYPRAGAVLRPRIEKNGYARASLCKNGTHQLISVHRLVACAFIPNPESLPVVNHKNGNKVDNRVANLEWCTHQENCIHAVRNSLYQNSRGERVAGAKLCESDVLLIRNMYREGLQQHQIAEHFGLDQSAVSLIVSRKRCKHVA